MTQPSHAAGHTARGGSPPRAVVHAAGMDTEYLRAGHGSAIVMVAGDLDDPDVHQLMEQLESRYLVLVACPRVVAGFDLGSWYSAFLEGLGVANAHLLLHSSLATSIASGDYNDV